MGRRKIHIPSIFQGKLDFKPVSARERQLLLSMEYPVETFAFRALLVVLFALICGYMYFVGASILNIIARREAVSQSAQVSASIGDSERLYFSMSESLTPEAGESLGLGPVSKTAYVYRPGAVTVAERAHNEI